MQNKVSDGLFYDEVYLIASDSMDWLPLFLCKSWHAPHHLTLLLANKNRTADCRAVLLFI